MVLYGALGPHWNMVLFCTLEQLSLIWPASTASRPSLEYGAILYSGAAQSHLAHFNSFQALIGIWCYFVLWSSSVSFGPPQQLPGPHWNMVLFCTLEQLSFIWPTSTASRPSLEYGAILYSGAAQFHLAHLDSFQAHVENMCGVSFPPLIVRRNASILGLTCRLLADEGRGNLLTFCPKFKSSSSRTSNHLHSYDPASHLRFQNPCSFCRLDCCHRGWQAMIVILWDSIPVHLLLLGHMQQRMKISSQGLATFHFV